MSCQAFEEMLSAYIDGELSDADRQAVEEHLATCDSCKQALMEIRAVKIALQSLPQVEPPAELHVRIMQNLKPAREGLFDRLSHRVSGWTVRQWVPVAAAAMVLVVFLSAGGTLWYVSRMNTAANMALDKGLYGGSGNGSGPVRSAAPNLSAEKSPAIQSSPEAAAPPGLGDATAGTASSTPSVKGFTAMMIKQDVDRKIIQRAQISLQVSRGGVRPAADQAESIVKASAGYIESSSISESGKGENDFTSYYMVARIPQENLEKAIADLSALGKPTRQDTSAQDITDQYVDLDARLRNAQNEEQRLLQIMGEAKTVGELLQVEGEVSRVRGDIESMSAQIQNYDKLVALASVSFDVTEEGAVKPLPGPWSDIWRAFVNAWRSMLLFVAGIAPAVIVLAAGGAVVGLVLRKKARAEH